MDPVTESSNIPSASRVDPSLSQSLDGLTVPSPDTSGVRIVDRDVQALLSTLQSGSERILSGVEEVQEQCEITFEQLVLNRPAKGILFSNTVRELTEILGIPGAQLLTVEDPAGTIYGGYIYHLGGIPPEEDRELIATARKTLDQSRDGNPPLLRADETAGYTFVCCIDQEVRKIADFGAEQPARRSLYLAMTYHMIQEALEMGITKMVGYVRTKPENLAILGHEAAGWKKTGIEIQFTYPEQTREQLHSAAESPDPDAIRDALKKNVLSARGPITLEVLFMDIEELRTLGSNTHHLYLEMEKAARSVGFQDMDPPNPTDVISQ